MFESKTFEAIMTSMLGRVPAAFDKREGSVIYDALAPAAAEMANAYISLDAVLNETFADTASVGYLAKRASERGLSRIMATNAVLKAEFTPDSVDIPAGTRFSCEKLNYVILQKISDGEYQAKCETAGSAANSVLGTLIPINYIAGLKTAALTELLIPARDDETAEELRKRYYNSLVSQSYGGNVSDYREHTLGLPGVGAVKVFPVWNGGGTVKLTILDSEFHTPTQELISSVQLAMDPEGHEGEGYGLAPIGHTVTVDGATSLTVNITATITYQPGWSWEAAEEYIKEKIDEYFLELSRQWQDEEQLVVRVAVMESRILSAEGVLDISETELNGSASNLQLTSVQIPVRGTVNGNE